MPEPTYDNIAPLVSNLKVQGRTLSVTFVCPETGGQVPSRASARTASRPQGGQIAGAMQRTVMNELRWSVARAIRSAFGYNMVGRMASQVASQAVYSATSNSSSTRPVSQALTPAEQQELVVEAFRSVADRFSWDGRRWISAQAAGEKLSPFDQQVGQAPITHPYDRLTVSRMLVEVAAADGRVAPEEEALLIEFVDPEAGPVTQLMQRAPLTTAELGQSSRGAVRQTMLMLAWVLALSDNEFDRAEHEKLSHFAHGLGLSGRGEQEARSIAQGWVLDQAMERLFAHGAQTAEARQTLYDIARALQISDAETQEHEAKFFRRRGLA